MSTTGGPRLAHVRKRGGARADLPHALTFFLSGRQRALVLRELGRLHPRREAALLRALRPAAPGAHRKVGSR